MRKLKNEKMMVGMQGIGWCDIGTGFLCVSGCSAVWVEIGAECVARESGVGWRIFANFGGIVATSLAFRAEMLASRGSLCVTLHHRNATTPLDLHYNASKHDLMHWICHSANIIITFITIQPQPLSPSISSHEQPSQNTHTHPL